MSRAAIIVAHNQSAFTRRCLESLAKGQVQFDELVFVNNGSTDETARVFEDFRQASPLRCEYLALGHNVGGSASRNLAVRAARSQEVYFLDNDTLVFQPAWLGELSHALHQYGGLVAPILLYPPDGAVVQAAGGGIGSDGKIGLLKRGRAFVPSDAIEPVAWAPTACLGCWRADFLGAGGFDEGLDPISIGEDIDLCFRMRSLGHTTRLVQGARLLHYEGTTFNNSKFSAAKRETFIKHMRILKQRWASLLPSLRHSSDEELRYLDVRKDYSDLHSPRVLVRLDGSASFADPDDGRLLGEARSAETSTEPAP